MTAPVGNHVKLRTLTGKRYHLVNTTLGRPTASCGVSGPWAILDMGDKFPVCARCVDYPR